MESSLSDLIMTTCRWMRWSADSLSSIPLRLYCFLLSPTPYLLIYHLDISLLVVGVCYISLFFSVIECNGTMLCVTIHTLNVPVQTACKGKSLRLYVVVCFVLFLFGGGVVKYLFIFNFTSRKTNWRGLFVVNFLFYPSVHNFTSSSFQIINLFHKGHKIRDQGKKHCD